MVKFGMEAALCSIANLILRGRSEVANIEAACTEAACSEAACSEAAWLL